MLATSGPGGTGGAVTTPHEAPSGPCSPDMPIFTKVWNAWLSMLVCFRPGGAGVEAASAFEGAVVPLGVRLPSIPQVEGELVEAAVEGTKVLAVPPSRKRTIGTIKELVPDPSGGAAEWQLRLVLAIITTAMCSEAESRPVVRTVDSPVITCRCM